MHSLPLHVICSPWCWVGKRALDKAIAATPDVDFEVCQCALPCLWSWHCWAWNLCYSETLKKPPPHILHQERCQRVVKGCGRLSSIVERTSELVTVVVACDARDCQGV